MRFEQQSAHLYLLMYPDLPWQDDPLRENPQNRLEIFDLYHCLLTEYHLPFEVIKGQDDTRLSTAILKVEQVIH
jgi:nicotinamide riboside kinase